MYTNLENERSAFLVISMIPAKLIPRLGLSVKTVARKAITKLGTVLIKSFVPPVFRPVGSNADQTQCLTCGARDDHSTRSCPISKTCYTCGMKGHINKTCPNRYASRDDPSCMFDDCDRCGSRSHYTKVRMRYSAAERPNYLHRSAQPFGEYTNTYLIREEI